MWFWLIDGSGSVVVTMSRCMCQCVSASGLNINTPDTAEAQSHPIMVLEIFWYTAKICFDKHLFECYFNVILLSKPHFCKDHGFLLNILWNHVWISGDLWYPKASDASWWYSRKGLLFIIILLKLDVSTDGWVGTQISAEWVLITGHLPHQRPSLIISSSS